MSLTWPTSAPGLADVTGRFMGPCVGASVAFPALTTLMSSPCA